MYFYKEWVPCWKTFRKFVSRQFMALWSVDHI